MRRCWRREEVQESQGPRVPRSRGPKVPGSQGPRYLKLTFKYELDSKEGPSCFYFKMLEFSDASLPNFWACFYTFHWFFLNIVDNRYIFNYDRTVDDVCSIYHHLTKASLYCVANLIKFQHITKFLNR